MAAARLINAQPPDRRSATSGAEPRHADLPGWALAYDVLGFAVILLLWKSMN